MPFSSVPSDYLSKPANFAPGTVYFFTTLNNDLVWSNNLWLGGIGSGRGWLSQATAYLRVPVTVEFLNGDSYNPTGDTVQFAFIGPYATTSQAADYPPTASTTWYTGTWDPDATYDARILIGPSGGTVTLGPGSYQVYLRIVDNPSIPILWAGPLQSN